MALCMHCGAEIDWAMIRGRRLPVETDGSGVHDCVSLRLSAGSGGTGPATVSSQWTVGFHPAGILVGRIEDGSPAARAGLQPGDVIIKADGNDTPEMDAFNRIRNAVRPSADLMLTVRRYGEDIVVPVRRP